MFTSILIIIISGIVIYLSGSRFTKASSEIGYYFNLSPAVKGATLDAIAGSFPELMIAIFSVTYFHLFDFGVGIIAGSVLFNILIIPSVAVFFSPIVFRVSREVVARDAIFYNIAILALLGAVLYSTDWGIAIAVIFIAAYIWYTNIIVEQTKEYQTHHPRMVMDVFSVAKEITIAILSMVLIGIAAYFLTEHAIIVSTLLGIPAILVGFSVIAVATSIPDTVMVALNAKSGDNDDAMSHIFGSNIFNIFVGLGLPLFLATVFFGETITVAIGGVEIMLSLFLATILVNIFIVSDYTLSKKNAVIMTSFYLVFLAYLFFFSV